MAATNETLHGVSLARVIGARHFHINLTVEEAGKPIKAYIVAPTAADFTRLPGMGTIQGSFER